MPRFRREFTTYAEVEAESEDEVDNIDMSDQIIDNVQETSTFKVSD